MVQLANPNADDLIEAGYTDEGGATTNLFQSIDEGTASPNDADYVESPDAPASDVYVCGLEILEDPVSSSGHVVRYRYAKSASGGAQIDLTVELRQGYVNEGTPGTLIASWSHVDISDVVAQADQTLSGAEADAITDYSDLSLRFVFNQV